MRVITDTNKAIHEVQVVISVEELAARLGYSGLHVTCFQEFENNSFKISMQNEPGE